ncbi:MAG: permease, partial [Streptosporangiales bacterium]|nr:permease [Streptosporangiales bacterium]
MYAGASRLLGLFFLFWLLGVLFAFVDALKPYDDVVQRFGGDLASFGPFLFALAVALV